MLSTTTLHLKALEILRFNGLEPEFPPEIAEEAEAAASRAPEIKFPMARDLRHLLWSSIDSPGARDLDQVEYVESIAGTDSSGAVAAYRVFVGIADVAAAVPEGGALDRFAAGRGTSVYTGTEVFPLLPECLTHGATSLLPGEERRTIVAEMSIGIDGSVRRSEVYSATIVNKARLGYDECGAWLVAMSQGEQAEPPAEMAQVPELTEQMMLQWFAARALRASARKRGALEIELASAAAVVQNGAIVNLALRRRTLARTIIETFMLAANTAITDFLHTRQMASIERIVRLPDKWPRLIEVARERGFALPDEPDAMALASFLDDQAAKRPDDFLGLSQIVARLMGSGRYEMVAPAQNMADVFGPDVSGYTHSTAPNRRYADLIVQRQVQSALANAPAAYGEEELQRIAEQCNRQMSAARRAEREVRKAAAAELLAQEIGAEYEAIVTSIKDDGHAVYARVVHRPVEGRIIEGDLSGLEVGEAVRVRLVRVNPDKGWIDFALV